MKTFFKRLYGIILALALCVGLGLVFQYHYFDVKVRRGIEDQISLKLEYMSSQMDNHIKQSVDAIHAIKNVLDAHPDDELLLQFLEKQLKDTPSYLSLYYGTPENRMINGSGWIPPENFDLRTRPWYTKAIEEKKLITTSLYMNASKDHWIVTYAMPVYDENNHLKGVIGGDKSLQSMIDLLRGQQISEHGYSFFLDHSGKLIMHSAFENLELEEANAALISNQLNKYFETGYDGIEYTVINGKEGYLAWNTINETGWIIGNFAPVSDFLNVKREMQWTFMIVFAFFGIALVLLFVSQKKMIIQPLLMLDHDIQKISVDEAIAYRLPVVEKDPFKQLRLTTNEILDKTQDFFETMNRGKEELVVSENKNRAIINVLPDMIFVYDKEGNFIDYLTNSLQDLLVKKEDFIGKNIREIMPESIAQLGILHIQNAIETGALQDFEYSLEIGGEKSYFESRMIKVNENEVLSIVRNITDQKLNLKKIEELSYHDQLTGLYNRRYFEESFRILDTQENLPLALVIFDVNGLKLTNDAFGHLAGDELLIEVAEAMRKECRSKDVIARIGGDEFVILFSQTEEHEVRAIVERIHQRTKSVKLHEIPISISAGWAIKKTIQEDPLDLFIKAEDSMYRKKLTESQSMRNQTIQVIVKTLNEKNEREKIHSDKVSFISKEIGEAMGLGYETLKEIEIAGLLHDIGKIAIKEELLNKPGQLTEAEYIEIKKHPEIGYQILKSVDAYSALAEYVLNHHERWDGKGYPRGVKENEIPLISRIIAVADAYEAMTSDRSYRKAMDKETVLRELKENAGTQFDKEVVEVLLKIIS